MKAPELRSALCVCFGLKTGGLPIGRLGFDGYGSTQKLYTARFAEVPSWAGLDTEPPQTP
jgi:hypothetical protein